MQPHREIESNFLIRWLADTAISLGGWLFRKATPYALFYTVTIDEDDISQE